MGTMLLAKPISDPTPDDSILVQASLSGNRAAFEQIVTRYQSLVCSLAYSATGSLERSEDLAQETFVAAWQRLPSLREPEKLRAWLCGIARNLISNAQRRASREPGQLADSLDSAHEVPTTEPTPPEQAVNREEAEILWQALEKIPEIYREPLVLYYREHRSVDSVARQLELSTDAVKQRLSRGRNLLHEQVLALVENTLERSRPGQTFALGVMTALPVMSIGTAAATTSGAASAKTASWLTPLSAILTAQVLWFVSSVIVVAGIGGLVGWQMSRHEQTPSEQRWVAWFWRLVVFGLVGFLFPVLMLDHFIDSPRESTTTLISIWLALCYIVPAVPLVLWAIANHHGIRTKNGVVELKSAVTGKLFLPWVAAATIVLGGICTFNFFVSEWSQKVSPSRIREIVTTHPEAEVRVDLLESGNRWVCLIVSERGKSTRYAGPLDEDTYSLLKKNGIHYETRVQGRDFDVLGWPVKRFGLMTILIPSAGIVILIRTWRRTRKLKTYTKVP
jgi:RNA polymerase sigma factor (sigma-70 family)